jgi:hypothetical protein
MRRIFAVGSEMREMLSQSVLVVGALLALRRTSSPLPPMVGPDGVLPERDVAEAVGAAPPVDANADTPKE